MWPSTLNSVNCHFNSIKTVDWDSIYNTHKQIMGKESWPLTPMLNQSSAPIH